MSIPTSAEFVIIGGGAIGCGIAYALAKAGKTDVVVIESQRGLALGTSSQGAGLCGQVRTTPERTRLAMHSAKTFSELQAANAPVKPDWNEVGSLRLASTAERVGELEILASVCAEAGLEVEFIEASRAQRMWPRLNLQDVLAALWCPTDGYMKPSSVVATYEHYCREHGVQFLLETAVKDIDLQNGKVAGVETTRGIIPCRYAINAAGPFAYHVARMVGLELPIIPIRHSYFVSAPIQGLEASSPVLRIPDSGLYARVEDGGLLLGGWEEDCVSLTPTEVGQADVDPERSPVARVLQDFAVRFTPLLPEIVKTSTQRVAKGWPTFTPDGRFIVGESSQVSGFVMAGGCNAHGISGSPGLGQAVVDSVLSPNPSEYVQSLSPDRFVEGSWTWQSARTQAESLCRNYYEIVLFDGDSKAKEDLSDREHRFDPKDAVPGDAHVHGRRGAAKFASPNPQPPRGT